MIGKILGLFRRSQPVSLDDPVFGRLLFDDSGFWMGKIEFSPIKQQVEVLVDADESGPSEAQREWLKEVQARYESVFPSVVDAALPEMQQWDETITKEAVPEMLKLESVSIDNCTSSHNWELSFFCEQLGHWIIVTLCDMTPESVLIDG